MFYRRKIVFALLEQFDGGLERTRLQKLIFLLSQRQSKPNYEFIPHRFGCYSFSLKADLDVMAQREWLAFDNKTYSPAIEKKYYAELNAMDKQIVLETISNYGQMSTRAVTTHTYINFPYFASRSTIADEILPSKYLEKVHNARNMDFTKMLFTIGYEGISLEEYLNRLVKNNIKALIDVRKNPLSQKFGFSKKLLQRFCRRLDIDYIHIPDVGIDSSKRRELNTQDDYNILFDDYKKTTLETSIAAQKEILALLEQYQRIALTCFEAETCQCHRTPLAEKLVTNNSSKIPLKHI
ncbi:DUF488 domain-containing protein [Nonlabens xiamenensis]|uniref:DUF488 domain-containing protein n=1 Tax=Nonlabens xiamenensis TaxID=2341043 RepID=UPI000F615A0B|nr:DUF488 domain-containing protein [Nonlabens xiamenensis]